MSHTYTSRPSVAKTGGGRGRGRGRGTKTQTNINQHKMQGPGYTTGGAKPRPGAPGFQTDPSLDEETEGVNSGAGPQERIQR